MSSQSAFWEKVTNLFDEVIKLPSNERAHFLKRQNVAANVISEVQSLLQSYEEDSDIATRSPAAALNQIISEKIDLPTLQPGETCGPFTIISFLGKGASAHVYLAREESLGRLVAIKVTRFRGSEARVMAHLEHENIVRVFYEMAVKEKDLHIICMQYIGGSTLDALISNSQTEIHSIKSQIDYDNESFVMRMGLTLSNALAFAHQKDTLHLDIKPANILIDLHGKPYLADFNVARAKSVCEETTFGGTEGYMAPEHRHALKTACSDDIDWVDARADIYSLGIVLRELAEFCKLQNKDSCFSKVLFERIIAKATADKREDRFASADEFAEAFANALELCKLEKQLERPRGVVALAMKWPILTILATAVLPQLLGSLVNITYNLNVIVAQFSLEQKLLFQKLVMYYNFVVYPICVGLFAYALWPLHKIKNGPLESHALNPREEAHLRKRILSLPLWIVLISSLGWLPGSVLFPYLLRISEAGLAPTLGEHLFVSFLLSWLISLAYSALYAQAVTVRAFYPYLLAKEPNIQRASAEELHSLPLRVRFFQALAIVIPLVAADLIVFVGPEYFQHGGYKIFRTIVMSILALSVVGLFFLNRVADETLKATWIFTKPKRD